MLTPHWRGPPYHMGIVPLLLRPSSHQPRVWIMVVVCICMTIQRKGNHLSAGDGKGKGHGAAADHGSPDEASSADPVAGAHPEGMALNCSGNLLQREKKQPAPCSGTLRATRGGHMVIRHQTAHAVPAPHQTWGAPSALQLPRLRGTLCGALPAPAWEGRRGAAAALVGRGTPVPASPTNNPFRRGPGTSDANTLPPGHTRQCVRPDTCTAHTYSA